MSSPTRSDKSTPTAQEKRRNLSRRICEICIFAMLSAMMFASKIALEWAPNIHMLGMFTMVFTVVYRWKALIPIYGYAVLLFLFYGFAPWCIIHLYVWTVLWGVTMLIPRRLPTAVRAVIYPTVCGLHGLLYGTLCALTQVPIYYNSFALAKLLTYIASGLYFDVIHAIGNVGFGLLILPLSTLILKIERKHGML